MYMRKIAAAAGFATGAALAFAPLASADLGDTVTSTLGSEASSLNGIFQLDALLSNVPSSDYALSGLFDVVKAGDVATVQGTGDTAFDSLIYGLDPVKAGLATDPGSYNVLNGALTEFYNAYNVEAYSLANGGVLDTNPADYIDNSSLEHALGLANTADAAQYLFNFGVGDLEGYFGDFPAASDSAPAAATDITSTVSSEITSLNSMFESDAALTGVPMADIATPTGGFDTLVPGLADTPQLDAFDTAVFGFNPDNVSLDPGAYDLFNGALVNFDDAYNVELFSLLNPDVAINTIPLDDLFGTSANITAALASDSASTAVSDFLTNGFSDLLGYF